MPTRAKDVMPFEEIATQSREGRAENCHSPESGIPVEVFRLLDGIQGIHFGRNETPES
jgi:hypothetical protein